MRAVFIGVITTLIVFSCFLGVRLPAAWVHAEFFSGFPLSNIQGSIWRGQARVQYAEFPVDTISWQLDFWPLLSGEARVYFEIRDPRVMASGNAVIGRHALQLDIPQAHIQVNSINVMRLLPYGAAVAGELEAKAIHIELNESAFTRAEGTLRWSPAYLVSPQAVSLQGYIAVLQLDANELAMHISDQGGPLAVGGAAWLSPMLAYRYNLDLSLREQAPKAIQAGLLQLGQADAQGVVHINASGRLR